MHSFLKLSPLVLLAVLANSAQAKDIVLPAWAAHAEAPARTNFPWGIHKLLYQQVFDADGLGLANTVYLKQFSFRPDGKSANLNHNITVDLEVNLSTCLRDSLSLSTTFAQNRGKDLLNVIKRRKYIFSGFSQPAVAPGTFDIKLILDKPFPLPGGKNLLMETRIWGNQGGAWNNWDFAGWLDGVDQRKGAMKYFGSSCPGSAGWPAVTGQGGQLGVWTGMELWTAPAQTSVIGIFGISKTNAGALPLPFSLTGMGATKCWLNVEPVILIPAKTLANGHATTGITLPENPNLVGQTIYSQFLIMDKWANPAGLTASGAVAIQHINRAYTGFVYATHDLYATSGVSRSYQGAVTKLTF